MINYIIPAIFGISSLIIIFKIMDEWQKSKRNKALREWFEQKQRHEIENKVRKTIEYKADYWDNFNTELYVKYLEKK